MLLTGAQGQWRGMVCDVARITFRPRNPQLSCLRSDVLTGIYLKAQAGPDQLSLQ